MQQKQNQILQMKNNSFKNHQKNVDDPYNQGIAKVLTGLVWVLFVLNTAAISYFFPQVPTWKIGTLLRINGFSLIIVTVITFFSGIVHSYSVNYMKGFKKYNQFMFLCFGFTFSVILLVISNNIFILLTSWLCMGLIMAKLIGISGGWAEAKASSIFSLKYFLGSAFFLSVGVITLCISCGKFELLSLIPVLKGMPLPVLGFSAFCIIMAAVIQSAMFPFHKWLLSAMTAPTPSSALMHAGFVNGAGIILTLFAPLFFFTNSLTILFIIGGLTAISAQFAKLLQVNVKQKLACSTIAQMGFMIMQCGLGFFNAAVAHLILHGFYKAYLFLSSGEEIEQQKPTNHLPIKIKPLQAVVVLIFGILGALFFAYITGKGTRLNSGIFLTLIVAITVGQATYNIVKQNNLSLTYRALVPAVLFLAGIGVYGLIYNGITKLMADMPMTDVPLPISFIQVAFGILFLLGFFLMKLGTYRKVPWLYVKLLNGSQPHKKTILMYTNKSL